MAFDVSGSLPIHRHTELSPAMTEPIGRLVLPAMDCRHREHQAMKGWARRGSACAFLASVSLGGCAAPDPQHTLDSLLQQQNALEFFCARKDPGVYPECPINASSISAKIHSVETLQQPVPPPKSLTAEEEAAIIAGSYRYDREWEAKGTSGRVPREYDRSIEFVLTSGALFRSPSLDPDQLQFWFLSNPYPGIICGSESQPNVFGINTDATRFAAYFSPAGKLSKIAEPARIPQESLDWMYADRLNGPIAASDEAALFRICGIVPAS